MKYLPGNAQDIGSRSEQQDSFAFSDPKDRKLMAHAGLLAVVADGMGGLSNGQGASLAAVRAFLSAYEQKPHAETIPAAMHRSFLAACEAVDVLNRSEDGRAGSTLVAAVAHNERLYWLSAGDSRLYLLRRGRVVQLSRDHSYREQLLDQVSNDQISMGAVLSDPGQEYLTSYIGKPGVPETDCNLRPLLLEPDDCVVLCTDGIYRGLSEKEIGEAFSVANPSEACESIKRTVLGFGYPDQDNLTVVALRCVGRNSLLRSGLRLKLLLSAVALLLGLNIVAATAARKALLRHSSGNVGTLREVKPSENKESTQGGNTTPNEKDSPSKPKLPAGDGVSQSPKGQKHEE